MAFEFTVSEPEKKERAGLLDFSYWTYHVYAKTSLTSYPRKEIVAVRRYNDFAWLRNELVEAFPGAIVPPIPEKSIKGAIEKVVTVNVNVNPLLEYRQRALHKFLSRVGAHPLLSASDVLKDFLLLDEAEFKQRMEAPKKKAGAGIGQSLKELTFSWGRSVSSVAAAADAPAGSSPPAGAAQAADPWSEVKSYVDQLDRSLCLLRERIELLVKRRRDTSSSLLEFGKSFVKIGEIEGTYDVGTLPKAFTDVGHHSEHLSIVYQEQADNEMIQVVETINYYLGLANAIREVIKRIGKLSLTRDTFNHSLSQAVEKVQKLQQSGGSPDAIKKAEAEVAQAKQKKEEAAKQVEDVEAVFNDEMKKFHVEKQSDIKQMLKAFVELQVEYSNKMKSSWESVTPSINSIPANAAA